MILFVSTTGNPRNVEVSNKEIGYLKNAQKLNHHLLNLFQFNLTK